MAHSNYIQVTTYCKQTNIDRDFVHALEQYGLIEVKITQTEPEIAEDDITEIERMFRLHKELGINLEGIDTLNNLLKRMRRMETELFQLKQRLKLYE
ncbi:chaperone modulator CbpM [Marixanthomonas ophiurae]|uniref:MerR family transcriptional regulator n=1 Tax=Marixanthomonas ophiurae TaxID=387659 RepID=A0A3E1Q875_9FLAO|nr:chaperone modulator CbpM [Marixanthomonas ophiurae]RFN58322.1 MerR family transcriptional regulator [Marixanthomonas ophiurae]